MRLMECSKHGTAIAGGAPLCYHCEGEVIARFEKLEKQLAERDARIAALEAENQRLRDSVSSLLCDAVDEDGDIYKRCERVEAENARLREALVEARNEALEDAAIVAAAQPPFVGEPLRTSAFIADEIRKLSRFKLPIPQATK